MAHLRRRGKEWRERVLAAVFSVLTAPLAGAIAAAIKLEGLVDRGTAGPPCSWSSASRVAGSSA